MDLLYYNNDNYDEFLLDYNSRTCQVRKKVVRDENGIKHIQREMVYEFDYPTINLKNGNYKVKLLSVDRAYLLVRLMIQNIYTTQFATKVEVKTEISQKADEIDISVDKKLSNYTTTTDMNSAINLKADSIVSTVNQTTTQKLKDYTTKAQVNSAIEQKADSIISTVERTYATKNQLDSTKTEFKQTTDSISLTVSNNDTKAHIISKINDKTSTVQIGADNISLKGKTLDFTGDNISIVSNNFNVDKNGLITAKAGKIADYTISGSKLVGNNVGLSGKSGDGFGFWAGSNDSTKAPFRVGHDGSLYSTNANISGIVNATDGSFSGTVNAKGTFNVYGVDNLIDCTINNNGVSYYGNDGTYYGMTTASTNNNQKGVSMVSTSGGAIGVGGNQGFCDATGGFYCYRVVPISKEEYKKNIKPYTENAINILKNTDIYTYNYKVENDEDKKHIGLVIGENYRTPEIVTSNNNDGIDIYCMVSVLWKAVQEQQETIENMQKEILKLKGEKINGEN